MLNLLWKAFNCFFVLAPIRSLYPHTITEDGVLYAVHHVVYVVKYRIQSRVDYVHI